MLKKKGPTTRCVPVKRQNTECNSSQPKNLKSEWHQTSPQKSHGMVEGSAVTSSSLEDNKQVKKGQRALEGVPDDKDRTPGVHIEMAEFELVTVHRRSHKQMKQDCQLQGKLKVEPEGRFKSKCMSHHITVLNMDSSKMTQLQGENGGLASM